jgi:hypothetical protein
MGDARQPGAPETAGSTYEAFMPQICDFRIFTAPAGGLTGLASLGVGLSDAYHSIPLSTKKSYKVANDTTHDKAFTIQAFKDLPFGAIVNGLNMIHGLWAVAQPEPNEVYFSITAMETESTKYSFLGEKTLNEINLALFKKKAWAFADPTTRGQIEAVVGALVEGMGALDEMDALAEPLSDISELVGRLL